MKVSLTIERQDPPSSRVIQLPPSNYTVEFLYKVSAFFEDTAMKALDEAQAQAHDGDFDALMAWAKTAKSVNDTYLDVYGAAERFEILLHRDPKDEEGNSCES